MCSGRENEKRQIFSSGEEIERASLEIYRIPVSVCEQSARDVVDQKLKVIFRIEEGSRFLHEFFIQRD
jgi:hypothetical protein